MYGTYYMIKAVGEVTDLPQEALRPAGLILACPLINVLGAYQALQATGSAKLEKTAPFMAAILLGDKPVDRQAMAAQKRPLELHFFEGGTPRSGYGRLC